MTLSATIAIRMAGALAALGSLMGPAGSKAVAEPAAVVADAPQAAKRSADAGKGAERKAAGTIAQLRITGDLPDGVGQGGLLADVSPRLHRIVERLDKVAGDERVAGVVLSIESPAIGRGRADELRAAIARLRQAGKPVTAVFVGGSPAAYAVAAACDTVAMPAAATLELTGVRAEMMFFKGMLDRLGVDAEILQVGEFKGSRSRGRA